MGKLRSSFQKSVRKLGVHTGFRVISTFLLNLLLAGGPMQPPSSASGARTDTTWPDPGYLFFMFILFMTWGIFCYMLGRYEEEHMRPGSRK